MSHPNNLPLLRSWYKLGGINKMYPVQWNHNVGLEFNITIGGFEDLTDNLSDESSFSVTFQVIEEETGFIDIFYKY